MSSNYICNCTKLNKEKLKSIVFEKNISFQKLINQTGATQYCGSCFNDVKQNFFLFRYQKKICKGGTFLLNFNL